ncbi:LOW QUALITY PROTEIN: hypothetical protein TorRG33x02_168450 [Trema orientale]|uniref:Uncharacterized protein n=1 Tax=Trema orientale TaxID=63057 RepID=A0A2P5EP82_TREOI|nr:LOW QUALITY PROTEIN: hypothetical protein TorRG33x02_168450 [Trema orientale]
MQCHRASPPVAGHEEKGHEAAPKTRPKSDVSDVVHRC